MSEEIFFTIQVKIRKIISHCHLKCLTKTQIRMWKIHLKEFRKYDTCSENNKSKSTYASEKYSWCS
jgi:hypothetical protein